jgi:NADPH:quinone reductase-like Zn-dependent oxidoreductase
MNELFEAGKVKPVIEGPFPLNEFMQAFRIFGKGEHKGKVVLAI